MNIHEFQAKELLLKYGIPIPAFRVVSNLEEVSRAIKELNQEDLIVKIQVHAGGRGKAGGVKYVRGKEEILRNAKRMLGMRLVNQQTGKNGVIAHQLLLSQPVDIAKEYFLGIVIDRINAQPILIVSHEGGMEIEEMAARHPEKILKIPLSPSNRHLRTFQLHYIAKFLGWTGEVAKQGMALISACAKAFFQSDASLLEINPLALSKDNKLWALDAKLSIDDNALFRQKEIANFYDPTQLSHNEVLAKEYDLAYVALDGNIGCMVNGAGLAMATMDLLQHMGGAPANFLDVGGGATKEKIAEGFKIILADHNVKAIFVNIFGGIMNCVTIAEGLIHATREQHIRVPIIVRMEGTNVDKGKYMLLESQLAIIAVDDLADAARKAVLAAGIL